MSKKKKDWVGTCAGESVKSIYFCRKGKEEKSWEMRRTQSVWLDIAKDAQNPILIIDDLDHMLLICGTMLLISTGKSGLKRAGFERSGLTCGLVAFDGDYVALCGMPLQSTLNLF